MADFVNTIDLLGDEAVTKALIERTITEFNDDVITTIGKSAFSGCTLLTSVNFPNVGAVQGFSTCTSLTRADFQKATSIAGYTFSADSVFATLILRGSKLCTLTDTTAFNNSPFASGKSGGTLIVPRSLVESYKTATNWSVIWGYGHNRFLALEDYTIDGTITGEIDWDKLGGTT